MRTLPNYPNTLNFISGIAECEETFLYDRLDTPGYGFWPHLEYFLGNLQRFVNYESIIERLTLAVPLGLNKDEAWRKWQIFRSAQAEVTSIFIIENYVKGQVLEIVPTINKPTPDLKVKLFNQQYLEVKAQSGQQHGSIHPRLSGLNQYSPANELDLKSWLFEEKISSRNNQPMKPKIIEADKKGASILLAMIDIEIKGDLNKQVPIICPENNYLERIEGCDHFNCYFYRVTFPARDLKNVKEVWLFHESHLDSFLALSTDPILLPHMKNKYVCNRQ